MKQTKLLKNKMRSMKNQSQSPQSNITVQVEVVANPVAQTMIILVGKWTHWGKLNFWSINWIWYRNVNFCAILKSKSRFHARKFKYFSFWHFVFSAKTQISNLANFRQNLIYIKMWFFAIFWSQNLDFMHENSNNSIVLLS